MSQEHTRTRRLLIPVAAIALALTGCTPKSTGSLPPASIDAARTPNAKAQTVATTAPVASPGPATGLGGGCWIDTRIVTAELRERAFARLESTLADLHSKVRTGACSDRWLLAAMQTFSNTEPALGAALDEWVTQHPRSALALAARGEHRYSLAMHRRGGGFSQDTPKAQLDAMEREFEGASEDLRNAIALDESLTPAHAILMGIAAAGRGPLQERAIFERGTALAPHSFAIRHALLRRLEPKWGGSLDAIDKLLATTREFENRDPELRVLRGYRQFAEADMLFIADRHAQAVERFDAALASGDLPWGRLRRVFALLELDRLDDAETDLRELLAQDQYPAEAWFHLGRIAQRRGQHEQALEFFDRALAYDGGHPDVLRRRARLAWDMGQYDAALANLATAAQVTPDRADVHALRGELLYRAKRNGEAAAALERATLLDPAHMRSWRYRGLTLLRLKDRQNTIAAFDWAISIAPKDAQLRFERGFAQQRLMQDNARALPDFREAARLAPQSATYQYSLASTAYRTQSCDIVPATRSFVALCDAGRCRSQSPEKIAWARRLAIDPAYASRCPTEYAATGGAQ